MTFNVPTPSASTWSLSNPAFVQAFTAQLAMIFAIMQQLIMLLKIQFPVQPAATGAVLLASTDKVIVTFQILPPSGPGGSGLVPLDPNR